MSFKAPFYIALVHYPVYNKRMETITTSVTNLDLHDISRAARTYDASGFYVVHPNAAQKELVATVRDFWQQGYGAEYNPDRKEALSLLRMADSLDEVVEQIEVETGQRPMVVGTDARIYPNTISYLKLRQRMEEDERPVLIVLGTGFGIIKEVMLGFDLILEPIMAAASYNHLSVRSAAAIIIDRLRGESWYSAC